MYIGNSNNEIGDIGEMKISAKNWMLFYIIIQTIILSCIALIVIVIDPFFHYHKPLDNLYYTLESQLQRYYNDGITKHFDYNAIVTGTSMTENFKATEVNDIFSVNTIKVPFSGGYFKEINDNLNVAFEYNSNIEMVVRSLDMEKFFATKDTLRFEESMYPWYLYNENPFDDIKYVLNRDVVFSRCWEMIHAKWSGGESGITSFDKYSRWMDNDKDYFNKEQVLKGRVKYEEPLEIKELTVEDKRNICENIYQNVIITAQKNPNTEFYYFIPPYSIAWWGKIYEQGNIKRQLEAEELLIEMVLKCDNIKLFSYNNFMEITTNLSNYKDVIHYSDKINSMILLYMKNGIGQLTKENYREYLETERKLYTEYDYNSLFE